jgi:hypothetical protein
MEMLHCHSAVFYWHINIRTLLKINVKTTNFFLSYQFKLVNLTYILLIKWNWLARPIVITLVQRNVYW